MPHPLDVNYELLKAKLQHLDKSQEQYAVIEKYLRATEPHWRKLWKVNIQFCLFRRPRDWFWFFIQLFIKQVVWDDFIQCKRFGHLGL